LGAKRNIKKPEKCACRSKHLVQIMLHFEHALTLSHSAGASVKTKKITNEAKKTLNITSRTRHLSSSKPIVRSASRHHLGMSSPYFART
jgi:hypothetical protein